MPVATDAMLARLQAELEERQAFQDGLVEAAQGANRDLNEQEMELYTRAGTRIGQLEGQLQPLREGARIAVESARRTSELAQLFQNARQGGGGGDPTIEYRSAGAYIAELYYARLGDEQANQRLEIFHRATAHQTTTDNPGLLPETIVGPVINFIDESRPLVSAIGPTDLGTGSWSYAKVTQHTQVGLQSAEKAELASRKMLITKTALAPGTYGGYVNVSRQDIQRTTPGILDMVIADLAAEYAITTEAATGTALVAGGTAGPTYPATPTAAQIASAIYSAAGSVYSATLGQGRVVVAVSPDMLGIIGPLFPPINPQNAYGTGFSAAGFSQGNVGSVSGLSVIMSAGLASGTILVFSTSAVRAFEYRYGALQVVEPSVWGVQVGYAGDFQPLVVQATGVQKVTQAP